MNTAVFIINGSSCQFKLKLQKTETENEHLLLINPYTTIFKTGCHILAFKDFVHEPHGLENHSVRYLLSFKAVIWHASL